MSSRPRQRLAAVLGLAVAATSVQVLVSPSADANPAGTGLVINEVYGGGGNTGAVYTNDFIELYNPTSGPISVDGLSLQYRAASPSSGTPGSSNVFALPAKTVQPGGYFLVQAAPGTTVTDKPLPVAPDAQTSGTNLNLAGTGGQIYLANGTAPVDAGTGTISSSSVVDFVGWGTSTTSWEGAPVAPDVRNTAPATTNTTSISRTSPGVDTDSNKADFAAASAPTPTAAGSPAGLDATGPGAKTGTVGVQVAGFTLAATGGTAPYSFTATGLPPGVTVATNGAVSGTPTTVGTYTPTVTATDSATPTPATDTATFTFTVADAPNVRPIAELQGTGATTPLAGQPVRTRGVVTAAYPTGGFNGFNIQTPGADSTPGASDGIFVYGGTGGFASYPAIGDSVEVTGTAAEYVSSASGVTSSLTQVTDASWSTVTPSLGTVSPLVTAWFTSDVDREAHEGELITPSDTAYTVTNSYATWQYGEVGLATGTTPLTQPTEVVDAQDTAGIAALTAANARRLVTLDDGKSANFGGAASGTPSSWLDATHPVRAGAKATLKGSFVVDHRNGLYKLQPPAPVDGLGTNVAEFANTRVQNAAPANVGGDIRLATFNVLNYFPTTGEAYVASGAGTCTFYNDRAGAPIGVNTCTGSGPRGAANQANFERQQAKIVAAINGLTASVVSLEELENSVKFGKDRDDAIGKLVTALNAAAGAGTWAYVPSPAVADRPAPAEEDVIRTGFIYKPAAVTPVGSSMILKDEENFDNAREPLAQAFKRAGAPDSEAFGVIVNHLKSKGDSSPPATGDNANGLQGAFNGDRVRQVGALLAFANSFKTARGIQALFLAGDFNSYSEEDPVQAIEAGGFTQVESGTAGEETYFFNGLSGSLDHVFGNAAAMRLVTGADVWNINSPESVSYQYGRFNYNVTSFYGADQFAASDHDPEIVGLKLPAPTTPPSVVKSTLKIKVKPAKIRAGKSRVTVVLRVKGAGGVKATGPVQLTVTGRDTKTMKLRNGRATFKVGKLSAGKKKLYAYYGGSDLLGSSSDSVKVTVKKK